MDNRFMTRQKPTFAKHRKDFLKARTDIAIVFCRFLDLDRKIYEELLGELQ